MSHGPSSSWPAPQPILPATPSNEPVNEFLVRRERELTQQIDALRGQIAPKEQEREQIRTAMRALGLLTEASSAQPPSLASVLASALSDGSIPALPPSNSVLMPSLGELLNPTLTIKQMALAALRDHFHKGATPSEIRDYIKIAYGREVDRNSISPQLARLREEGFVLQQFVLEPDGPPVLPGKWVLAPRGVSANDLDAIGHWPPGAEHQQQPEEPSDEELAREIEAANLLGQVSLENYRKARRKAKPKG
jgi:hypothetical protein